mgnify:CR=1 FL=1
MATNHRIRFMANNLVSLNVNAFTFSTESVGFEAANALDDFRSSTWKGAGFFEIKATNNKLYFNDGSDRTATIVVANYLTPAAMATEIQTQMNAVSSGYTVTFDSAGETYKFTITKGSSFTLQLVTTTNAIWSTIGFTGTANQSATSHVSNEQRNHTNEFLKFDLGYQAPIDFIGVVGPADAQFPLSTNATVTLQGNNIDDFTSPPFSQTLTVTTKGIFKFFDNSSDNRYRYWRFNIIDKYNTAGPAGIQIGNIYMGSYITLNNTNVGKAFEYNLNDPSSSSESEAGVIYFDKRTKYRVLSSLPIFALNEADRESVEKVFKSVGKTTPFYISVDPTLLLTDLIEDFTMFGVFIDSPSYQHIVRGLFQTNLAIRELI